MQLTKLLLKLLVNDSVAVLKDDNGVEITENSEKTELLGQYFASVFTRETEFRSHSASNAVETAGPVLDSILFPTAVVERELKNLKEAKCSGPDNIPAKFLKELANELSKPLAHIFRSSFELGRLPSEWKTANIFPIYKGGARTNANNYRPVSLICICCKIMEAIVKKATMEFLEQGHLLSDLQHGFRQNRSCLSSLLLSTEQWTRALDEDGRVDVIYADFKKAFDSVPHKRLIYKLSEIGIRGRLLTWITDFLTGRSQTVCIEASTSTPTPVLSGVPQGSVLGPLLFLVYINDCVDDLGCSAILFADDVKLWRPIRSDADRLFIQPLFDGHAVLPFHPIRALTFNLTVNAPVLYPNYLTSDRHRLIMSDGRTSQPIAGIHTFDLPAVWLGDITLWLRTVESRFVLRQITREDTEFHYVVAALPTDIATDLRDIIDCPPTEAPSTALKETLISRICLSTQKRLQRLISEEDLGDRKPTQLLGHLEQLADGQKLDATIFKQLFLQRLPPSVQAILAPNIPSSTVRMLAETADRILEYYQPPVTVHVASRSTITPTIEDVVKRLDALTLEVSQLRATRVYNPRSPSITRRPRSPTPNQPTVDGFSWYHHNYGSNAHRCHSPCKYKTPALENPLPTSKGDERGRQILSQSLIPHL
ncbi:hypothetical protein SprV_0501822900 [Sparganum proliferum]